MHGKLSLTARIASFSYRHKWYVLAAWLVLFVAAGAASSGLGSVLSTDMKDFTGSDSATAREVIDDRYGERPLTELVVIRAEGGSVDDPAYQATVNGLADQLRALPSVASVTTYFETNDPSMVSTDRQATLTNITLAGTPDEAMDNVEGVVTTVREFAAPAGYAIHLTGSASLNHEFQEIYEEDMAAAERFGLPVALVVILLAFGSLIAAFVPLVLGIFAIVPAMGSVFLIGQAFELSNVTTNIITMIGLAVGIDYSLFIIGRYREELAHGHPRAEALTIAADSSGRAVFFSGMTVLLALAGMLLVRNSIFMSIGIGAMLVVIYAVLASLTLLPAILGALGRGINWVRIPFLGRAHFGTRFWGAVTHAVQKRPVVFVVLGVGLLLAAAAPLATIDLGVNGADALPKQTSAYQAITALQDDFAGGMLNPMRLVVDGDINDPTVQASIDRFQQAVSQRSDLTFMGVTPDASGQTAIVEVAAVEAGTGEAAQALVRDLRETVIPQAFDGSGASVYLGGDLPMFVDMKGEMDTKTPVVFAFVLGLSFILLLLVFRSVAIPAKALLMNLLSVGAAYGLVVAVFQHGWGADLLGFQQVEQIEFWLPLFLFSILFGLSMDYHVFLLSRIKEEFSRTGDNKLAVATGVQHTAGMITSAAIIMVAVFAAFASGRMYDLQQMGFGLAVAVFIDATLIRSVLVPASMQLLGKYNWWMPKALHWLPELNVEGGSHPAPVLTGAADD